MADIFVDERKEKNGRRSKVNNSPSDPFRIPFISHHSLTFGSYSHVHHAHMCKIAGIINCPIVNGQPASVKQARKKKTWRGQREMLKECLFLGLFLGKEGEGEKCTGLHKKVSLYWPLSSRSERCLDSQKEDSQGKGEACSYLRRSRQVWSCLMLFLFLLLLFFGDPIWA